MRRTNAVAILVAVLAVVPIGPTSAGSGFEQVSARLPAAALADLIGLQQRIGALRESLGGTFAGAFATMLRMEPSPPGASPAPGAIAGLETAVRRATGLVGSPTAFDARRARVRAADRIGAAMRPPGMRAVGGSESDAQQLLPIASGRGPGEATRQAALAIAAALDRHLPAIRTVAGPPTGLRVAGCDLVDELPMLCVGSEGDNTYVEDAALLVDLGGDDTYRNSAGSAPFIPEGSAQAFPVSVNLDLGNGDDTYEAPATLLDDEFGKRFLTVGQGVGLGQAVGILVDESGDDRYTARAQSTSPQVLSSVAIAQGAGMQGVGALFDLGGTDRYEILGVDGIDDAVGVSGQGASGAGAGLLLDRGEGNDVYVMDAGRATQTPAAVSFVQRGSHGQAFAAAGVAILADDGGKDSLSLLGGITHVGPSSYGDLSAPIAGLWGQGFGLLGEAIVLGGPGGATYRIVAESEGLAWNQVLGQGIGGQGGHGVLHEVAGDDRYTLEGVMHYDHELVTDDGCRTEEGEPCPSAVAEVSAFRSSLTSQANGQGAGYLGGLGLMHDVRGADVYRGRSEQRLDVTLRDQLTDPQAPPRLEVIGYAPSGLEMQGSAIAIGGSGMFLDETGTDVYRVDGLASVRAEATSAEAPGAPEVTARTSNRPFFMAQGANDLGSTLGVFLDLGGVGDRIETSNLNPATTVPEGGEFRSGDWWPTVQGSFGGVFAALGVEPHIRSTPSRTVCPTSTGFRGFGSWSDCIQSGDDIEHEHVGGVPVFIHHSKGEAPLASGAAPTLEVTPDTPERVAVNDRVGVGARLLAPGGSPIVGVPIHFDLQVGCYAYYFCTLVTPEFEATNWVWSNYWEAAGVTDEQGVARAMLPFAVEEYYPQARWRVYATFDGADGLYPRHAAKAVTIDYQ